MWLFLLACAASDPRYPVTGKVVEVRSETEVVVAHDAIPGFMDAMTMPFHVRDAALLKGVDPGDTIAATFVVTQGESWLEGVTVTAEAPAREEPPELAPGQSVAEGELFPMTPLRLADGSKLTLGEGQKGRIGVTFIYTRCPVPEYCPLTVSRMQGLQEALPPGARLLAVTMDPEYDTEAVLTEFGKEKGAIPGKWDFARVPPEVLFGLAEKVGLEVHGVGLGITHDVIFDILDEDGRLIKRYRDMKWERDEVVKLLTPR